METEQRTSALEDVRLAILRQHTQLAALMDELESHANGVVEGKDCVGALNDALVLFHARLVRHLDFEETRLVPLLGQGRAESVATLRASLAEHVDQRDRADGLLHDRIVFTDARTLAREALTFIHLLRQDMADEDRALREIT